MKLVLLAKSSSGEPYPVEFAIKGDFISVFCQCPAGVSMMVCKHKIGLITAQAAFLHDSSQVLLLSQIQQWGPYKRLRQRTEKYLSDLAALESEKAELAKKEKAIKGQMAKDLRYGDYSL